MAPNATNNGHNNTGLYPYPPPRLPYNQSGTNNVNNYINSGKDVMSMSPTLIIPLQTAQQNKFKVRTLLDSGSGTNWIVKNILQHVHHTKKGSEILEVHSFHGAVKKKYQLVDVYYIDQHNNSQAITCYVHDSYVRHICLDMTTYLQSEYPNVKPYTLPCAISDPGDKGVDHGHESQGIGMVLCPASTNRLRTSHGIVHINELDILLEDDYTLGPVPGTAFC